MIQYLPFEKPIEALDKHVAELSAHAEGTEEARMLRERADKLLADTYARLSPWERTLVARHPQRPRFEKLVAGLFTEFLPIAGDRTFGDDQAIIGGFARFEGRKVMVIGHVKGEDTPGRLRHNFGMARPEGYRKAIRLMELAEGARAGRGHRPLHGSLPRLGRAAGRGDHRRGRIGRGGGARGGEPGADVRTCGLFSDLARRLRFDPVAQRRAGGDCGRGDAGDRGRPPQLRRMREEFFLRLG